MDLRDVEMVLLGYFAAVATKGQDRTPQGPLCDHEINEPTGMLESSNGLVRGNNAKSGFELALELLVSPKDFAASLLRYRSGAGAEDVEALIWKKPELWTDEEIQACQDLTFRVKTVVRRLAQRRVFDESPREGFHEGYRGEAIPMGADGFCTLFRITYEGLQEAIRRTRGTRYESVCMSRLASASPSRVNQAPAWAQAEWRRAR